MLLWFLFTILYIFVRHGPERVGILKSPTGMRVSLTVGIIIWLQGLFTIVVDFASFRFSVLIFNTQLAIGGPALHASLGTGFTSTFLILRGAVPFLTGVISKCYGRLWG